MSSSNPPRLHTIYSNASGNLTAEEEPNLLADMKRDPNFVKARRNLSTQEIRAYAKYVTTNDNELRDTIVATHWSNPICNSCHAKDRPLQYCDFCYLVFYCSQKCEEADWDKHRGVCCDVNAPFDTIHSPYRPVVVRTDN